MDNIWESDERIICQFKLKLESAADLLRLA